MKKAHIIFSLCLGLTVLFSCTKPQTPEKSNLNLERAQATLDSLYNNYSAPNTNLLRENYPFDTTYTATYLASAEQANIPNQYSYLWPYSGTLSAVSALFEASNDKKYQQLLDTKVLQGLEEYFDQKRDPAGYASYINGAPTSDRFYDDNVWLGIDYSDLYLLTKEQKYLDKAKLIWDFVASGIDDKLDGGIYWCEQKKESKNTCSNAPGSVFALKLFEATKDSTYFHLGKSLYEWTKKHLQDTSDYLYYDNIRLDGTLGKAKFAYNSGQMMQSAALLYKLTGDKAYLTEAQNIAKGCYNHFFADFTPSEGAQFKLLKRGDVWFIAVMLRGFIELYHLDNDKTYMDAFNKNLDYAWNHMRDDNGLFNTDWTGEKKDDKKWLLTQGAMVEMYARMAAVDVK
ncbi:glycoside hydrolase family 76 protein [Prevotella sp. 10(H)]|uniref:glycoside hydrolase family 76 protein n=1 Tax=Prevotella sp. 10(H) TaxID=1158294 RepID=UPI0004A77350|nr:glycoside hydrolase family 76 protein [Prevotella sp. 10(H)]